MNDTIPALEDLLPLNQEIDLVIPTLGEIINYYEIGDSYSPEQPLLSDFFGEKTDNSRILHVCAENDSSESKSDETEIKYLTNHRNDGYLDLEPTPFLAECVCGHHIKIRVHESRVSKYPLTIIPQVKPLNIGFRE
jgi:hypothetical protein